MKMQYNRIPDRLESKLNKLWILTKGNVDFDVKGINITMCEKPSSMWQGVLAKTVLLNGVEVIEDNEWSSWVLEEKMEDIYAGFLNIELLPILAEVEEERKESNKLRKEKIGL